MRAWTCCFPERGRAPLAGGRWLLLLPLLLSTACSTLAPEREVHDDGDGKAAERRYINDSLLVVEATDLLESIRLLQRLEALDGEGPLLNARILFRKTRLQALRDGLLACGRSEKGLHPRLARRCLLLADRIEPSSSARRQLGVLARQASRKKQQRALQARRRAARKSSRLLAEAKAELERGALRSAAKLLEQVLQRRPEDPAVQQLLTEVQAALEQKVTALMALGDRLYRAQRTDAALAVWEAALTLNPGQQSLIERIERGRRVLEKLSRIRDEE